MERCRGLCEEVSCLEGAGPEAAREAGQLAREGQQVEVGGQAQCQPGIALCVLHQLHQLLRRLKFACGTTIPFLRSCSTHTEHNGWSLQGRMAAVS